jgi:hypothetical protein
MAGIDATILLSNATATKVIFFEAKWPRFGTAYHSWDHAQTASGLSHFSDQLDRQAQVSASFAVFEMFYVEYPFGRQPPFLFDEWSSCVWHDDAIRFRNSRSTPSAIWTQNDCKNLIITKNYDIGAVLANVAMCAKGVPIRSAKPEEVVQEFQLGGNVLAIRGGDGRD